MAGKSSMFGLSVFGESKDSLYKRIEELEASNRDLTSLIRQKEATIHDMSGDLRAQKKQFDDARVEYNDVVNALDDTVCKCQALNSECQELSKELDKWRPARMSNGRFIKKD